MPSGVYKRKPRPKWVRAKISRTLKAQKTANSTGKPVYPWNRWFAKNRVKFVVVHKYDFTCSVPMMVRQIRNEASKRGVKVSTSATKHPKRIEVTIRRK